MLKLFAVSYYTFKVRWVRLLQRFMDKATVFSDNYGAMVKKWEIGDVATIEEIKNLMSLRTVGVVGIIIGRALYRGNF